MNKIKFSIIIPHHNIPKLLENCLDSIPSESEIEIIVVDDNSDYTYLEELKIIERKNPKIKWIYNKEGKGAGHARNIGMQKAKGEWIIFIDADDLLLNDTFKIWIESSNKFYSSDIIYFDVESNSIEKTDRIAVRKTNIKNYSNNENLLNDYLRYEVTEPWGKLFKREFLRKTGISFQESLVANDYMFSVMSGHYASKISYFPQSFYLAVNRKTSLSNSPLQSKKLESRLNVYLSVERFFYKNNIRKFPFSILVSYIIVKHIDKLNSIKKVCTENKINWINVIVNSFISRFFKTENISILENDSNN